MASYELGEYESKLIGAIYEAAFDLAKWKQVLVDICEHICANEASLLFYDAQHSPRNFVETAYNQNNQDFVEHHIDAEVEVLRKILVDCQPGQLVSSQKIAAQLGMTYEEYLGEPAKISERQAYQARMAIPLITTGMTYSVLGLHCLHGAPELSADAVEFVARLSPHVVNSLRIHNKLTSVQTDYNALTETLKLANSPAVLVDKHLMILHISRCAERVITGNPDLMRVNGNYQLELKSAQHQSLLLNVLADLRRNPLAHTKSAKVLNPISLPHPSRHHPLKLRIHKIDTLEPTSTESGPYAVIFIQDVEHVGHLSADYLKDAYGFTASEAKVAQLFLQGLPLAEISKKRCRSQETTRWQIKQIMQKTNTHSQADLVRLLMALADDVDGDNT